MTTTIDDKTKERSLLLLRFYWQEDLYNIGKELRIPTFDKYHNYWDIDYDAGLKQAALDVASVLSDEALLRLVKQRPPRYKLQMGGFQGNYYCATEDGDVTLESSWETVCKNAQKAFTKWEERAYGVLQAIINKGGKSGYFELIDEIEKVLGYEFVPSSLLPRLDPLRLVFKTGSNKYPEWTIPPEIIPIIEQELLGYKRPQIGLRPAKRRVQEDASAQIIHAERIVKDIVGKVVQARRNIDLLFKYCSHARSRFFMQNEMAVLGISKLCANEDDFNNRILSLSNLVGGIDTEALEAGIKDQHSQPKGSINLLERWLIEVVPDYYDPGIVETMRKIQFLRSKKFPIHADVKEFIEALDYFDSSFPVTDWQNLWEATLQSYLRALRELEKALSQRREQLKRGGR